MGLKSNSNYIYFIIKNNVLYKICPRSLNNIKDANLIFKFGSFTHPGIVLQNINNGKLDNKKYIIGGYKNLIKYISDNSDETIILAAFNRASIGSVLKYVNENANLERKILPRKLVKRINNKK